LERAIIEHGVQTQVELLGSLDNATEMPHYLAAADLCVAPAHIEGLNRVVAEAAALGTPAIVSTTTGIASLVRACNAGIVVEPRDVDALAAAILHLLEAPGEREAYGARALRLAQRFRTAVVAEALLELYSAAQQPSPHSAIRDRASG
jgi:glycosyltransferase involved in cell wall biosynthesis